MVDIVTPAVRSRMMSGIRSKNTRHEVKIRKALHAAGFRYRLHRRDLPGTPDITLPRYRAVVFVHGCFWHGHDCHLFKWPSTRPEFWAAKIRSNQKRDLESVRQLLGVGWRICTIWECSLRGRLRLQPENIVGFVIRWLLGAEKLCIVRGNEDASISVD